MKTARLSTASTGSRTALRRISTTIGTGLLRSASLVDTWSTVGEIDSTIPEITYQFPRSTGNVIGAPTTLPGKLQVVETRQHFPGNVMHVAPNRFHSIEASAACEAVTFVTRF